MWDERLKIGLKRPRAPKRRHWRRGPSSALISDTYRSSRVQPWFSSALAIAERIALDTGPAAALGMNLSTAKASLAPKPRTVSTTSRTLRGDMGTNREIARTEFAMVIYLKPPRP